MNQLLTIDEFIEALPIRYTKQSVYNKVNSGEIIAHKYGKRLYFEPSEVERFINSLKK